MGRLGVRGFCVLASVVALGCGSDGTRGGASESDSGVIPGATAGDTESDSGSSDSAQSDSADSASDGNSDSAGSDTGTKFDVGSHGEVGPDSCEECGQASSSYIFIANSNQSTMSKINTTTMVEEGRYLTRASADGNPSRTSVSIDGTRASINNRGVGGVLTVWTSPDLCDPDTNGTPGLQTSSGPNDVLPWGEDDCVAWFTDIPGQMRPIAWTSGEYNPSTCRWENQKLWVANSNDVFAYRLDAETGVIEDMVSVPNLGWGYGGAADTDGNFWLIDLGTNLARVDADDLSVTEYVIPHSVYGITVASDGNVWMSANMSGTTSAVRFNPTTEQFDLATGAVAYAQSGIVEDAQGRMWMNDWNSPYSIYPIDKNTMVTGQPFVVQGATSSAKGIAVDKDGNVWTAHFDNNAYRMDVDNNIVDVVGGLDYPYTYSDMTGSALTGVACGSPVG